MPLIINGAEADNHWTFVSDDADLPTSGCITVSLSRLQDERESLLTRNSQFGVRLAPEDDPSDLVPYLDRLALIEVSFPKYTDGRGYSQAQLLRRRYGYSGELRAVGHVLRDQILYMNRSGFDAFETSRADLSQILEALSEYSGFYQPAADRNRSVFARRHEKA
ncbi:MAG: DUF934 domain-containing protein [Alphaproteobacteria bacterium]|jgi:uncharacterized protein (DUF934 family)|nr:DUF934 domain-containing protein [Alphaproteobacteria bacterium]